MSFDQRSGPFKMQESLSAPAGTVQNGIMAFRCAPVVSSFRSDTVLLLEPLRDPQLPKSVLCGSWGLTLVV